MPWVGEQPQSEGFETRPQRAGVQMVPRDALVDAFFDDDAQRLAQRVHVQDRRRVMVDMLGVPEASMQAEVEIPALDGYLSPFDDLQRAVRERDRRQAGRRRQALL